MGLRFDHHITAELAALTQGAAGRVHKGDPLCHPVLPQPLLQHRFALRQLLTVVDPIDLIGISHFHMHGLGQHRHGVGEVELPLVVIGAELGQHLR